MKARDVMSSPVITLRPDTPARAAAALLVAHGFTAAPVVEDGRVIGIATEADLMRGHIVSDGWVVEELPEAAVRAVMTPAPLSVRPEDDLANIVALMVDSGVRSVPIVDDGELVGILSGRDVLRCVARRELTSEDVRQRRFGSRSVAQRTPSEGART